MRCRRGRGRGGSLVPLVVLDLLIATSFLMGSPSAASDEISTCFGEIPTIVGTPGDDRLVGTPGPDAIEGFGGDDSIDGRGGDDLICADEGDDRITGGGGADLIGAGPGDDTIRGGVGNDAADGGLGSDAISGGPGDDGLDSGMGDDEDPSIGDDALEGGPGDDLLSGGFGSDELSGGPGADLLFGFAANGVAMTGGPGDDTLEGSLGPDDLEGGPGDDELSGSEGDDRIEGNAGDDRVSGSPGDDALSGGPGDDALSGDEGNDVLSGGPGEDRLLGGEGDDVLSGGPGEDVALGGAGVDQLVDEEEPSLAELVDLGERELIREWAGDQTIAQINTSVAGLGDDRRARLAEVLLDTNGTAGERDQLLRTMRLVLARPDLGFFAEIWSYTRIEMTPGGFFGACGAVMLDPPAFDGLSDLDTRNVLVAETFHSFDCVNRGPPGSLDEGSSIWVIAVGFPRPLTPGESWAEATYGSKLYFRDVLGVPDLPLEAPGNPTQKLIDVYEWLSANDPSRLPWNSTERLVTCFQRYFERLDRDVDFESVWLPAVDQATQNMLQDPECVPI